MVEKQTKLYIMLWRSKKEESENFIIVPFTATLDAENRFSWNKTLLSEIPSNIAKAKLGIELTTKTGVHYIISDNFDFLEEKQLEICNEVVKNLMNEINRWKNMHIVVID